MCAIATCIRNRPNDTCHEEAIGVYEYLIAPWPNSWQLPYLLCRGCRDHYSYRGLTWRYLDPLVEWRDKHIG